MSSRPHDEDYLSADTLLNIHNTLADSNDVTVQQWLANEQRWLSGQRNLNTWFSASKRVIPFELDSKLNELKATTYQQHSEKVTKRQSRANDTAAYRQVVNDVLQYEWYQKALAKLSRQDNDAKEAREEKITADRIYLSTSPLTRLSFNQLIRVLDELDQQRDHYSTDESTAAIATVVPNVVQSLKQTLQILWNMALDELVLRYQYLDTCRELGRDDQFFAALQQRPNQLEKLALQPPTQPRRVSVARWITHTDGFFTYVYPTLQGRQKEALDNITWVQQCLYLPERPGDVIRAKMPDLPEQAKPITKPRVLALFRPGARLRYQLSLQWQPVVQLHLLTEQLKQHSQAVTCVTQTTLTQVSHLLTHLTTQIRASQKTLWRLFQRSTIRWLKDQEDQYRQQIQTYILASLTYASQHPNEQNEDTNKQLVALTHQYAQVYNQDQQVNNHYAQYQTAMQAWRDAQALQAIFTDTKSTATETLNHVSAFIQQHDISQFWHMMKSNPFASLNLASHLKSLIINTYEHYPWLPLHTRQFWTTLHNTYADIFNETLVDMADYHHYVDTLQAQQTVQAYLNGELTAGTKTHEEKEEKQVFTVHAAFEHCQQHEPETLNQSLDRYLTQYDPQRNGDTLTQYVLFLTTNQVIAYYTQYLNTVDASTLANVAHQLHEAFSSNHPAYLPLQTLIRQQAQRLYATALTQQRDALRPTIDHLLQSGHWLDGEFIYLLETQLDTLDFAAMSAQAQAWEKAQAMRMVTLASDNPTDKGRIHEEEKTKIGHERKAKHADEDKHTHAMPSSESKTAQLNLPSNYPRTAYGSDNFVGFWQERHWRPDVQKQLDHENRETAQRYRARGLCQFLNTNPTTESDWEFMQQHFLPNSQAHTDMWMAMITHVGFENLELIESQLVRYCRDTTSLNTPFRKALRHYFTTRHLGKSLLDSLSLTDLRDEFIFGNTKDGIVRAFLTRKMDAFESGRVANALTSITSRECQLECIRQIVSVYTDRLRGLLTDKSIIITSKDDTVIQLPVLAWYAFIRIIKELLLPMIKSNDDCLAQQAFDTFEKAKCVARCVHNLCQETVFGLLSDSDLAMITSWDDNTWLDQFDAVIGRFATYKKMLSPSLDEKSTTAIDTHFLASEGDSNTATDKIARRTIEADLQSPFTNLSRFAKVILAKLDTHEATETKLFESNYV